MVDRECPRVNREDRFIEARKALAASGFTCSGLQGIRFKATHEDGTTISAELRTRLRIQKTNMFADLYMCFPVHGEWYLVPHDRLVRIARHTTPWLDSYSWKVNGRYDTNSPNIRMLEFLRVFKIGISSAELPPPAVPTNSMTDHETDGSDQSNQSSECNQILEGLRIRRVEYDELNARQKNIFNFQKVSGLFADYGFNCIKLSDDWRGTDFLAFHSDEVITLKIRLQTSLAIDRRCMNKNLYLCFPVANAVGRTWYLIYHDELVGIIGRVTSWSNMRSWHDEGKYCAETPSGEILDSISGFVLGDEPQCPTLAASVRSTASEDLPPDNCG